MIGFGVPGYGMQRGSGLDRSVVVKFMQRTYQELYPEADFAHLATTVDHYLSSETPLWWVFDHSGIEPSSDEKCSPTASRGDLSRVGDGQGSSRWNRAVDTSHFSLPIACVWVGSAIEQRTGDRHAHVFLLYVAPQHRRQGIGRALMQQAEAWAKSRGDRQIGLQVFHSNQMALRLYETLGYKSESVWMVKQI